MPVFRSRDATSEEENSELSSLSASPAPVSSRSSRYSSQDQGKPYVLVPRGERVKNALGRNSVVDRAGESIVVCGITLSPTVVFDTFWRFAAERHAIDERRRGGKSRP